MLPGRFFLGLGSGENLNEHIVGQQWPRAAIRLEMLEEAIEIIRRLWNGDLVSYDGAYYSLDDARIYTLPESLPPIFVAAAGPRAALLAARAGEGLITSSAAPELVEVFRSEGNDGPRYGQLTVCVQETEDTGVRVASEVWPTSALKGAFKQELPRPSHFEEAVANVTPEQVAEAVVCSTDPRKHIEALREFEDGGYTRVYIHQVGPDQQRFMDFYQHEVIPALEGSRV
jgi:G6PDH family F420-dependent oxidoreductase